nr:unnamed protein product [Callosobruchus chinensis]
MAPNFKFCPVTSVDVERSFSAYKLVLSDKRHKFTPENLENMLFLVLGRNFCDQKTFLKISKSSEMKEFIARNRIQRSLPQVFNGGFKTYNREYKEVGVNFKNCTPIRSTIPLISSRNIASPVQRPSPPPEDPLRITLYYKNFTLRFNQQKSRPKLDLTQTTKGKSRYFTRKFKKEIYEKNDWICGCSVTNSLFCFPCLLFGRGVAEPSWSNTGVTDLSHLAQKIRNMRMLKLISILS